MINNSRFQELKRRVAFEPQVSGFSLEVMEHNAWILMDYDCPLPLWQRCGTSFAVSMLLGLLLEKD